MSKKVILIEDSATDAAIIKELLEKENFLVKVLNEGDGILGEIEEFSPDLVIVDTVLPGIDGIEVCQLIREKYTSGQLKIIVITGKIEALDAIGARKAGADDYAVKALDCAQLLKAVKRVF